MIKIVYACNDGYMDGLYLSILSILRRSKETFSFYILTGDFSQKNSKFVPLLNENLKVLNKLVKSFNSKNEIKSIDCTELATKNLTNTKNLNKKKFSPYAALRLLIHLIPELNGKVIYLDCDIMANKDIKELDDIDLMNNEIGVCHNWWARHILKKDSFNSGVVVFDLEITSKTRLFEKAIEWFNKKKFIWPDQSALYRAATNVLFFPGNEYRFNYQKNTIEEDTVLKHFCACPYHWPKHYNIKQFQVDEVHKYLKIFNFDEDFKIWQEARQEWKK